jgi:citrate lyase subunit beta/citryl-CoA lyase
MLARYVRRYLEPSRHYPHAYERLRMNARRSWLLAPAHDAQAVARAAACGPDVLVLDLEYSVPPRCKEAARSGMKAVVQELGAFQGEVFLRIDRDTRWADVRAGIVRGVNGIVYPGAEEADEIVELDRLVTALESERGLEAGGTQLVLVLESARGFWNAGALVEASRRISALGIGRIDLSMQLGPVPQDEFRLYRYLMTRTLIAARTFGKQALGAHWRPGSRGGLADAEHTRRAAGEARLMGFDGCLCAAEHQVPAVNAGFGEG